MDEESFEAIERADDDEGVSERVSSTIRYDEYGQEVGDDDIDENAEAAEEEEVENAAQEIDVELALEEALAAEGIITEEAKPDEEPEEEEDAGKLVEEDDDDESEEEEDEEEADVDVEADTLAGQIMSALAATKRPGLFYNVETGKLVPKTSKKDIGFYTLDENIRIAGKLNSDKVKEALEELGYAKAKPDPPKLTFKEQAILNVKPKERKQARMIERVARGVDQTGEEGDIIPFAKSERAPKGTSRVVRIQYVERKVPLKLTEEQRNLAQAVGIPIEGIKYVPVKVYADEPSFEVTTLLPDPVPRDPIGGPIQIWDIAEEREYFPVEYIPPRVATRIENQYNEQYYVGAYVSFYPRGEKFHRGIVLKADDKSFTLLNLTTYRTYTVSWKTDLRMGRVENIPEDYLKDSNTVFLRGKSYRLVRTGGKKEIKPGNIVEVTTRSAPDEERMRGIVIGFNDASVDVNGDDGNEYVITYDDPSLRVATTPRQGRADVERERAEVEDVDLTEAELAKQPGMSPSKIYHGPPTDRLRQAASSYFEDVLTLYVVPEKKEDDAIVKKSIEVPSRLVGWEEYYKLQFLDWYYAREYDRTREAVTARSNDLRAAADAEATRLGEAQAANELIAQIDNLLAGGLTAETTDDDILQALLNKRDVTVFEATLRIQLEKRRGALERPALKGEPFRLAPEWTGFLKSMAVTGRPRNVYIDETGYTGAEQIIPVKAPLEERGRDISGHDLALFLSQVFLLYGIRYPPTDVSVIYERLVQDAISRAILAKAEKLKPADRVRREFEASHKEELTRLYDEAEAKYKRENAAFENARKETKKAESAAKAAYLKELEETGNPPQLSGIAIKENKLSLEVKLFEKESFDNSEDVVTYLGMFFTPLVYLAPGAAATPYAKFFQAKLRSGEYRVSDFGSMNKAYVAYYMPALTMSQNHPVPEGMDIADLAKQARTILEYGISELIDKFLWTYIAALDPSVRRTNTSYVPANNVLQYFQDPRKVCRIDSREMKGATYDESIIKNIPYEDLIICLDGSKNLFTCESKKTVLRNIALKKPNPYTRKPYSAQFIKDMRARYPEQLAAIVANPEVEEEVEAPKAELPKTVPKAKIVAPKVKRARPLPRKRKGKRPALKNVALIGDYFGEVINFNETLEYNTTVGKKTIKLTKKPSSSTQAVVISIDATETISALGDMSKLKDSLRALSKGVEVYFMVVSSSKVSAKGKATITRTITKEIPEAEVVYSDGETEDKLVDAIFDVVVDYEGVAGVDLV